MNKLLIASLYIYIYIYIYILTLFLFFQIFQIAYVIVKAANSPRPGNWILERSLDGVDYQPWQYYAITDSECLTRYNIHPRPGTPSYMKDDEVICTSYYSKIHPLENGEVRSDVISYMLIWQKKSTWLNWQISVSLAY